MTSKLKTIKIEGYIVVAIFLYIFFAWVSSLTPLVGDDWGYYINGMKGPLTMSMEFYQTWSGRFIGEFLGFALAANKTIWNFLFNPLVFSLTFVFLYKIISPTKEKKALVMSLILFFMFTVSNGIRMETFTFVVGSINYRFSGLLALIQLYIVGKYLSEDKPKFNLVTIIISLMSGIMVGLIMENIAGGLILANLLLLGYRVIKYKKIEMLLIGNIILTTGAFLMMRLSPGSQYRGNLEVEWMSKTFFEKIIEKYPEFIHYTFTENRILVMGFILVLSLLIYQKRNQFKHIAWVTIIILYVLTGLFVINSDILVRLNENYGISFWKFTSISYYFSDMNHLLTLIYWTLFAILAFLSVIIVLLKKQSCYKIAFYFILAMAVMGAMMLSPIIGPRCAIFTVYFLLIVTLLMIKELKIKTMYQFGMTVIISLSVVFIFINFITIYREVNVVYQEQERLIEEYKKSPTNELWLPSYPLHSIHSGEALAPYHQDTFKQYYQLPGDTEIHYRWN